MSSLHSLPQDKEGIEAAILQTVSVKPIASSYVFAGQEEKAHAAVIAVIKSLSAAQMVVDAPAPEVKKVRLTNEGLNICDRGSPEYVLFTLVVANGKLPLDQAKRLLYNKFVKGIDSHEPSLPSPSSPTPSTPSTSTSTATPTTTPTPATPTPEDTKTEQAMNDLFKVAQSNCMKNKFLQVVTGELVRGASCPPEVKDMTRELLIKIRDGRLDLPTPIDQKNGPVDQMRARKLVEIVTIKPVTVDKGPKFALTREETLDDLTTASLKNRSWETTKMKELNINAKGAPIAAGALHPLMKVRAEFRMFLLEMGFSEMPTNNYVESSFWNFDSLFQPQQHPARDAHDTFFLSAPEKTDLSRLVPASYLSDVKSVHEKGGYDSIGYRYDWSEDEAAKNILRTHTTAVSSRMLYLLSQECIKQGGFKPAKYFSIDKVFRNETLDATHLAEFHQVEGLVADYDLTLGDLIGVIKAFYKKIGVDDIRLKPAYNPYTEPSMEIFGYSKDLNKWMELGNSGVFRPEMLRPMGLPEGVKVIAWGLGLERPTMIKYSLKNIRDLVGPKMQLEQIRQNPIAKY